MEETRLTLLPDDNFADLVPALEGRLATIGRSVTAANFASLLDETMRQVVHLAFTHVGATEGTVWLADTTTKTLAIAYNTGPNAAKLVGRFKQTMRAGIISMVFSSEHSFVENEVFKNPNQDKSLDSMLSVKTTSMIATPFYFLNACRGVVSCVRLTVPPSADANVPGFTEQHSALVRHAAITLGLLIDQAILHTTVGLV